MSKPLPLKAGGNRRAEVKELDITVKNYTHNIAYRFMQVRLLIDGEELMLKHGPMHDSPSASTPIGLFISGLCADEGPDYDSDEEEPPVDWNYVAECYLNSLLDDAPGLTKADFYAYAKQVKWEWKQLDAAERAEVVRRKHDPAWQALEGLSPMELLALYLSEERPTTALSSAVLGK